MAPNPPASAASSQIPTRKIGDAKVMALTRALLAVLVGKVAVGVFASPLNLSNALTVRGVGHPSPVTCLFIAARAAR